MCNQRGTQHKHAIIYVFYTYINNTDNMATSDQRKRATLLANSQNRLDFILGKKDVLEKPVYIPPPPLEQSPLPLQDDLQTSTSRTTQFKPPVKSYSIIRMFICTILSIFFALNSMEIFPSLVQLSLLHLQRPFITLIMLLFYIFIERLIGVGIFSLLQDISWLVVLWVASADFISVFLGLNYNLQQSNIMWILILSLLAEFIFGVFLKIVRKIPNQLLQAFAPGPIVWMVHNFGRMIAILIFVVVFQDLGGIAFADLPRWLHMSGGVVFWSWVCLVASADVAQFFLS